MKKADLKTGMILELDDGEKAMVLLDTDQGDIASGQTWFPLTSLDNDLYDSCNRVMRIYQPESNREYAQKNWVQARLIWTRPEEVVEMTLAQVCKSLGKTVKIIK